jgi:hypothetical protein
MAVKNTASVAKGEIFIGPRFSEAAMQSIQRLFSPSRVLIMRF